MEYGGKYGGNPYDRMKGGPPPPKGMRWVHHPGDFEPRLVPDSKYMNEEINRRVAAQVHAIGARHEMQVGYHTMEMKDSPAKQKQEPEADKRLLLE